MINESGLNAPVSGINGHIVQGIAQSLRINYYLISAADPTWGLQKSDGNWTGVLGMIQRNEADMTACPTNPTSEKMLVAEQTSGIYPVELLIMNGRKSSYLKNVFGYIQTFSWQVWALLILSILVVSFVMFLSHWNYSLTDPKVKFQGFETFDNYFWTLLENTFNEGSAEQPPAKGLLRFLWGIWWLSIVVLMNAFAGQMKAALMIKTEMPRIEGLRDLSEHPNIVPYVPKDSAVGHSLQASALPHVQKVWKNSLRLKSHRLADTLQADATLLEVLAGKSVVLSSRPPMAIAAQGMCKRISAGEFYLSKEPIFVFHAVFHLNFRLPKQLRKAIIHRIDWMRDSGLISHWWSGMSGRWQGCGVQSEKLTLGFSDFIAIIYLLLFGLFVSCIVFFAELAKTGSIPDHHNRPSSGKHLFERKAK